MNKVDAYLEQGTQIVWLVISVTREVLVCTATSKHSVRDVLTAPDLLPGFELPVNKIFEGIPCQKRCTKKVGPTIRLASSLMKQVSNVGGVPSSRRSIQIGGFAATINRGIIWKRCSSISLARLMLAKVGAA